MNLRYSARAVADIADIFQYIAKQDVATALAVEADIRGTCEAVCDFPYASPRTDIANVFRAPVTRRGFTIFYRVRPRLSVVEIVRVVRGKRVRNLSRLP
jgi:plasmid stabilization system protein ParE